MEENPNSNAKPASDPAQTDSPEAPRQSEPPRFWQNFVDSVKKAYRELTGRLDTYKKQRQAEKTFDAQCVALTDLSTGKSIRGKLEGTAFRFLADVKFDPLHRYYAEGRTYRLSDRQTDRKLKFAAGNGSAEVDCYLAPFEIVISPIPDVDAALDEYERIVKAYEPNLLEAHKQEQTDVITLFVDFRKAVAANRRDVALFDAMVPKTACFAPKAAQLLADLISNIQ